MRWVTLQEAPPLRSLNTCTRSPWTSVGAGWRQSLIHLIRHRPQHQHIAVGRVGMPLHGSRQLQRILRRQRFVKVATPFRRTKSRQCGIARLLATSSHASRRKIPPQTPRSKFPQFARRRGEWISRRRREIGKRKAPCCSVAIRWSTTPISFRHAHSGRYGRFHGFLRDSASPAHCA